MVAPLKVQKPPPLTKRGNLVVWILISPLFYLAWLARNGQPLHFDHPAFNVTAQILLVALPATLGYLATRQSLQFAETEEVVVSTQTYWKTPEDWWGFAPLWPCALLGIIILIQRLVALMGEEGRDASLSVGSAFITALLVFVLMALYVEILKMKNIVRVSPDGLRFGTARFVEWEKIHHVHPRVSAYEVYLQVSPSIPFETIAFADLPAKLALEKLWLDHQIPVAPQESSKFKSYRICIYAVSAGILAAALYVHSRHWLDSRWLIVGVAVAGGLVTYAFEAVRGVPKIKRVKIDLSEIRTQAVEVEKIE